MASMPAFRAAALQIAKGHKMHIRGANFTTRRLGQHARTFAHGAGTALDKAVGAARHY